MVEPTPATATVTVMEMEGAKRIYPVSLMVLPRVGECLTLLTPDGPVVFTIREITHLVDTRIPGELNQHITIGVVDVDEDLNG